MFVFSPEIVQNQPYGDKADIWSFGCCLYEMCNLKAAFHTQNMLLLATIIVEGRYEPIRDIYSQLATFICAYLVTGQG